MERYYDSLTGLPGMSYFYELADAEGRRLVTEGSTPAILFMDISGMKQFNHKHGFRQGDDLLISFASLLTDQFGIDNCSRFIQDHFVVVTDSKDVEERIRHLFKEWKKTGEMGKLPIRVGIYVYQNSGRDIVMACDNAKVACDMIRNTYSSGINYYNKELELDIEKKEYIISNIDRAICEKWINVYYQPIVRAVNGRVCDEEALSRWIDPLKGFLHP